MTDKRKLRAKALQAKSGMSYMAAINQLRARVRHTIPRVELEGRETWVRPTNPEDVTELDAAIQEILGPPQNLRIHQRTEAGHQPNPLTAPPHLFGTYLEIHGPYDLPKKQRIKGVVVSSTPYKAVDRTSVRSRPGQTEPRADLPPRVFKIWQDRLAEDARRRQEGAEAARRYLERQKTLLDLFVDHDLSKEMGIRDFGFTVGERLSDVTASYDKRYDSDPDRHSVYLTAGSRILNIRDSSKVAVQVNGSSNWWIVEQILANPESRWTTLPEGWNSLLTGTREELHKLFLERLGSGYQTMELDDGLILAYQGPIGIHVLGPIPDDPKLLNIPERSRQIIIQDERHDGWALFQKRFCHARVVEPQPTTPA